MHLAKDGNTAILDKMTPKQLFDKMTPEQREIAIKETVKNTHSSSDILPEVVEWCKDFIATQPGSWDTDWMTDYQIVVYANVKLEEAEQYGKK